MYRYAPIKTMSSIDEFVCETKLIGKMKRYLFLITLLGILTGKAVAQSVIVDATIDSLQIYIGDQAKIKLQVSLEADKRAVFPVYKDTLVRGVEILDIAKADTQYINDNKRMLITQEIYDYVV